MTIQVDPIQAFEDNYIWVIHNHHKAILVDPGEAAPVESFLKQHQLDLNAILITHHHYDHINGVEEILNQWPCDVYAPNDSRIPFKTHKLREGDVISFKEPNIELTVIETPGHTLTHICFHNEDMLFCGDTLFSMGCGRMFEGTPKQYVKSLNKLKALPQNLKVFCTHEYTLSNINFALSISPYNSQLTKLKSNITKIRQQNKPSLPSSLKTELELNPFLKTDEKEIQLKTAQLTQGEVSGEVQCFAQMRHLKDIF